MARGATDEDIAEHGTSSGPPDVARLIADADKVVTF